MRKDGTLAISAGADAVTTKSSSFGGDKRVAVGHYSLSTSTS